MIKERALVYAGIIKAVLKVFTFIFLDFSCLKSFFTLDLGGEVIPSMSHISNFILYNKGTFADLLSLTVGKSGVVFIKKFRYLSAKVVFYKESQIIYKNM